MEIYLWIYPVYIVHKPLLCCPFFVCEYQGQFYLQEQIVLWTFFRTVGATLLHGCYATIWNVGIICLRYVVTWKVLRGKNTVSRVNTWVPVFFYRLSGSLKRNIKHWNGRFQSPMVCFAFISLCVSRHLLMWIYICIYIYIHIVGTDIYIATLTHILNLYTYIPLHTQKQPNFHTHTHTHTHS